MGNNPSPRNFANTITATQPVAPAVLVTSLTTLWAWDRGLSNGYFYAPGMDNNGGLANYISTKGYVKVCILHAPGENLQNAVKITGVKKFASNSKRGAIV